MRSGNGVTCQASGRRFRLREVVGSRGNQEWAGEANGFSRVDRAPKREDDASQIRGRRLDLGGGRAGRRRCGVVRRTLGGRGIHGGGGEVRGSDVRPGGALESLRLRPGRFREWRERFRGWHRWGVKGIERVIPALRRKLPLGVERRRLIPEEAFSGIGGSAESHELDQGVAASAGDDAKSEPGQSGGSHFPGTPGRHGR